MTRRQLDEADAARPAERPRVVTVTPGCRHAEATHVALSRRWLVRFASRQRGRQEDRKRGCQRRSAARGRTSPTEHRR